MTSSPQRPIQGNTMRVRRIDGCGTPVTSTCSAATSTGFVEVNMQAQQDDGTEITQMNAQGIFCIAEKSKPQLKWFNVTITFCGVDPELFNVITGNPIILDDSASPTAVGWIERSSTYAAGSFALETWTNLAQPVCVTVGTVGGLVPYGYFLLPWIVEGRIGDTIDIQNGVITFTVSGRTKVGNNWGTGPNNVLLNMTSGAAQKLLNALPTDAHRLLEWTYLAPPVAAVGCTT